MNIFCSKSTHTLKNYKCCLACAQKNKPMSQVFYCNMCKSQISNKHSGHRSEQYSLESQTFCKLYNQFKQLYKSNINLMFNSSNQNELDPKSVLQNMVSKPNFYHFFTGQTIAQLMENQQFKIWLLEMKFWECTQKTFYKKVATQIKQKLSDNQLIKSISEKKISQKMKKQEFKIIWETNDLQNQNQECQIEKVNEQLAFLQRQKQILYFFLKMYSSYSIQECYLCLDSCDDMIRKYSDCKALYLAKIRILQLIPRGCEQIQQVLKCIEKIDTKFSSSDLYYYYLAISEWQMIQNKNKMTQQKGVQNLFYQVKNKSYYRLKNVDKYIQNISKAISIKQRSEYYLACAIGHIVKEEYNLSEQCFQRVIQQKFQNEPMDNNYIFTQIKNNKFDPQTAIKSLQVRTMQFIKNIAKYFKKHKKYQHLLKCCEIMIAREPINEKIKIQFIKAILLHGNQNGNANRFKQHIHLAATMISQLRQAKKSQKQTKLLGKKLALVKARAAWDKKKFQESVQKFRQVPNKNSTDQYNLAASLFQLNKNQHDQDIYKEALQSINKAISLAKCQKPKYLSLKFYICCYLNDFETAKELSKYIDLEKNKDLLEYIQNYLS